MAMTNTPSSSVLESHSTPTTHDALGLRETEAAESATLEAVGTSTWKIYWAFSGLASLSGRAMPLRLAKRPAQGHRSGGQALPRRLDEALRA